MHVHTNYSHDSNTTLHEVKAITRKHDLTVAITDHNRIGGSLAARAMNIPVIPAIEVTSKNNKDILVYFYCFDHLIEFYQKTIKKALNPGIIWTSKTTLTEEEVIQAAQEYGAITSLAHPYAYIGKKSASLPEHVLQKIDAVEVMNFTMSNQRNNKAAKLCDELHKKHTAGSDSHHASTIGKVTVRAEAENPYEFLQRTKTGNTIVVGLQRKNKDVYEKLRFHLNQI